MLQPLVAEICSHDAPYLGIGQPGYAACSRPSVPVTSAASAFSTAVASPPEGGGEERSPDP